jgi:hypothetical protein
VGGRIVKKFFRVAISFFCLCILLAGLAKPSSANELDGFRGVKWGQDLRSLRYMKFIDELDGLRYYKKMNDEMHFGDAGVSEIAYAFSAGKLVGVVVSSKGRENARLIYETLAFAYGTPSKQNNDNYYWPFGHICIYYNFNTFSEKLFVSFLTEPAIGKTRWARQR